MNNIFFNLSSLVLQNLQFHKTVVQIKNQLPEAQTAQFALIGLCYIETLLVFNRNCIITVDCSSRPLHGSFEFNGWDLRAGRTKNRLEKRQTQIN